MLVCQASRPQQQALSEFNTALCYVLFELRLSCSLSPNCTAYCFCCGAAAAHSATLPQQLTSLSLLLFPSTCTCIAALISLKQLSPGLSAAAAAAALVPLPAVTTPLQQHCHSCCRASPGWHRACLSHHLHLGELAGCLSPVHLNVFSHAWHMCVSHLDWCETNRRKKTALSHKHCCV